MTTQPAHANQHQADPARLWDRIRSRTHVLRAVAGATGALLSARLWRPTRGRAEHRGAARVAPPWRVRLLSGLLTLVVVATTLGGSWSDRAAAAVVVPTAPQLGAQSPSSAPNRLVVVERRSRPKCTARPNYICGRAVDARGMPLAHVKIVVVGDATAPGYGGFEYDIRVRPDGTYGPTPLIDGDYSIHAIVQVTYQGVKWGLYIPPDDNIDSSLLSINGIVKNFTWKLTGLQPGGDPKNPASYYGAYISVGPITENFPAGSHLRFSLVPQGPLVDGSTGQSLTFDKSLITPWDYADDPHASLMDIPLGVYTISATGTDPNGNALNICFDGQRTKTIVFDNTFNPQGDAKATPDVC